MTSLPRHHQSFRAPGCRPHPRGSTLSKRSAFTLIELLVVIAIIAILAGLGFSGIQGAMQSSEKAQARNDVNQVASAVKAYLLEYGKLPDKRSIMTTLTGDNPKNIVFFEPKNAEKGRGGLFEGTELRDPWGEAYVVTLDDDYDNRTTGALSEEEHITTVVVETRDPDGKVISSAK